MKKVTVLLALRDARTATRVVDALDDGEGCTVCVADNGDAAIELALRVLPDILVVDAVLPHVDGLGVIDRLQAALGARMPRVIGGSMLSFADAGFLRRDAWRTMRVPWDVPLLLETLREAIESLRTQIDWAGVARDSARAEVLLDGLGVRRELRGFAYLACAAALAYQREARLYAIGEEIYAPIAAHFATRPQNVERIIRHAIESAMDGAGARQIYAFFGNTIDPTRGKPTNGQFIGMLAQRLRVQMA